jgi:urease accessory protein
MVTTDLVSHLAALQLGDSAFPSGRYTLSYGLEAVAQSGRLVGSRNVPTLTALLRDGIRYGVATSDGVALACAHRAVGDDLRVDWDLVQAADRRLTAVKLSREARDASTRTGRALLAIANDIFESEVIRTWHERVRLGAVPGNHAVNLGLISAILCVPRARAVAGELYAFASGWVAAAVRLGLTDHRVAQHILHRVRSVNADAAIAAAEGEVRSISSSTPFLDVMSMRHEHAELRLFAS